MSVMTKVVLNIQGHSCRSLQATWESAFHLMLLKQHTAAPPALRYHVPRELF